MPWKLSALLARPGPPTRVTLPPDAVQQLIFAAVRLSAGLEADRDSDETAPAAGRPLTSTLHSASPAVRRCRQYFSLSSCIPTITSTPACRLAEWNSHLEY